jgi:hypothetical protein
MLTQILLVKVKKSERSYKTVEIKVFLNFLLVNGLIMIGSQSWIRTNKLRIQRRIWKDQKYMVCAHPKRMPKTAVTLGLLWTGSRPRDE